MRTIPFRSVALAALCGSLALVPRPAAAQEPVPAPRPAAPAPQDSAVLDSAGAAVESLPGPVTRVRDGARQAPERVELVLRTHPAPLVARVAEVLEDGRLVRLDDGTTWEVRLAHRARSDGWRTGDVVRLRSLPAPTDRSYDLRLENLTTDWTVAARRIE